MPDAGRLLGQLFALYPDAATLNEPHTAHVVLDGHRVLSRRGIPGVDIRSDESADVVTLEIAVAPGVRVDRPIHTCVGLMRPHGSQEIRLLIHLGAGASAEVLAHCLFPNAEKVRHVMDATVDLAEDAELRHREGHYHGPHGGVEVIPRADVRVGRRARYWSDFSLTTGRVGTLRIGYRIAVADHGVAEITARVHGRGSDDIRIEDELILAGEEARGLIKSRVAVQDDARSTVIGITHGDAAGARGHMDCKEIVRGRAVATAEPIVKVNHPLAMVTHEAAIGTVDQQQLETLMAHRLTPDEAVEAIIAGLLR